MTEKQVLRSLVLAALAEVTLLGVMVFIAEPADLVGHGIRHFHPWGFAYLALPLLLALGAAFAPVWAVVRRSRDHSPGPKE